MAPLPSVPNCIRADIHWTVGTDLRALTRSHWLYSGGPPSTSDLNTLAGDFRTACTAFGADIWTGNEMSEFVLTDLSSSSGAQGSNSTAILGARSGNAVPASCCVVQEFQIARRYRGGKPRAYMPFGVDADLLNTQTWTSSLISDVITRTGTWASTFITSTSSSTTITHQCSVSYFSGFTVVTSPTTGRARNVPKLRTGGPVVDQVTGYNALARIGTQRKRLIR